MSLSLWNEEVLSDLETGEIPRRVQPGDLWQLGTHRLYCGDSTQAASVEQLGACVQAIITDPPYGTIQAEWDTITYDFIQHLATVIEPSGQLAVFCKLPFGFYLHERLSAAGWKWRSEFIWQKPNGGIKVSSHMPIPAHENIYLYRAPAMQQIADLCFNGYEAGENLPAWRKVNQSGKGDTTHVYQKPSQAHSSGQESGQRWIRSVLDGASKNNAPESERSTHPTQKPLNLVQKLVRLLTSPGGAVFDPFLGSGTTLIASESIGRSCYGIEQSPEYCDETLERWQRFSNQKARLINRQDGIRK